MITLTNADKALKTYYLDAVATQLDAVSPFYAAIEKHSAEVFGKEVKVAVVKGDNTRVIAGDEDGALPAAGSNRYVNLTSTLKNIYGTIEISDKALRASGNSGGAFVNLLNAEMEGLISSAKVNFSRMLYGDGNGYIGTITKTSGTTLTVSPIGRVYEGMTVDLRSTTGIMTGGDGLTVSSVDYGAGTVTLSATVEGTLTGKDLYVHGAYGHIRHGRHLRPHPLFREYFKPRALHHDLAHRGGHNGKHKLHGGVLQQPPQHDTVLLQDQV